MTDNKIPARLTSVFCNSKRPVGKLNDSIRHSLISHILKISPIIDNSVTNWEIL